MNSSEADVGEGNQRAPFGLIAIAGIVASATLAFIVLGTHASVVLDRIDRALDYDEAQHLHIAWLTAHGLRPFKDFIEDHSPLLHAVLVRLLPSAVTDAFPLLDVPAFASRARIFSACTGTLAVLSAAVLSWRVTKRAASGLFVATLLFGAQFFWLRGIADVRTDPLASMLFWGGVLLVTAEPATWWIDGLVKGLGVGLAWVGFLVNPKWPFMTAVLSGWAVLALTRSPSQLRRTLIPAVSSFAIVAASAVTLIAVRVGIGRYLFNVVALNLALTHGDWRQAAPANHELDILFHYCSPAFHPGIVAVVALVGLVLVGRDLAHFRAHPSARFFLLALALLVASAVEVRVLYPFPRLWPQQYVAWSICSAIVYALVADLARDAFARSKGRTGPLLAAFVNPTLCALALGLYADFVTNPNRNLKNDRMRWNWISYVQQNLSPGDTVWMRADAHPIGALDASYYWVGFFDLVPAALRYTEEHPDEDALPRQTDGDLPPCRVLAGADDVRFLSTDWADYGNLPVTDACLRRLVDEGRVCDTPFSIIVRVPRAGTDCSGAPK